MNLYCNKVPDQFVWNIKDGIGKLAISARFELQVEKIFYHPGVYENQIVSKTAKLLNVLIIQGSSK